MARHEELREETAQEKRTREREKRKTGRLTFRFNNFRLHSNFADCCVAAEVVKVELCGWNMTEEVE